jgi:DNA-binding response OmpR family regulator
MKKILLAGELEKLFPGKGSFLERTDIEVFTAYTSDQMLKIHKKEGADLIVTELDLPGMKSEEFFETIRKSEDLRRVSTIIICDGTLVHRERSKKCRANAVFTEPVDTALLHTKVRQFLNVAPRRSYRATIAVAIQGKFKDRPQPFWTENISAKGMLIRSEEQLAKGDGIFFSFFLPNGTHVSGYGEISRAARVKPTPSLFHYGIRFTNIDPDSKAAIEEAVNKMQ